MTVLDVFSWLPAKEISIEELEQIFIEHSIISKVDLEMQIGNKVQ